MDNARDALLRATVVVPHTDADGLAAGAIALRARGESGGSALLLARGETPFMRAPAGAAVLDWGVRPFMQSPQLVVDHHAPEAELADSIVVSGYGERPETTTSALMSRIVDGAPVWLAAVGAYGDLGANGFDLPECVGAPRGAVRRLTPLVNAPRRVPDGPVEIALGLLVESESAHAALADPRTPLLADARDAWQEAYRSSLRRAPEVVERAAHVRLSTPYQVHPLVAATWVHRLAPRIVIASNDDYIEGRVNFAVRGGTSDLRAVLRAALPDAAGEFAHGHDRATGGSLEPVEFERLLKALGLPA